MLRYVVHRLLIMVPTLLAISLITFVIIQLPPGDYLESYIAELQAQGESIQGEKLEYLRRVYGLDKPWWQQYLVWLGGLFRGDFGYSFEYDLPVNAVVGDRMLLTFIVSFATILFTWAVSFPIGVYSATHKYTAERSRADLHRLPRARHAQLPARAGAAVLRQRRLRHLDRRADGPAISRSADELGEVPLGARALVGAGDRDRHLGHRRA